jgi:hypothetical protein
MLLILESVTLCALMVIFLCFSSTPFECIADCLNDLKINQFHLLYGTKSRKFDLKYLNQGKTNVVNWKLR